jgi:hypothetical protein
MQGDGALPPTPVGVVPSQNNKHGCIPEEKEKTPSAAEGCSSTLIDAT